MTMDIRRSREVHGSGISLVLSGLPAKQTLQQRPSACSRIRQQHRLLISAFHGGPRSSADSGSLRRVIAPATSN